MNTQILPKYTALLLVPLVGYSGAAEAAIDNAGILNTVLHRYQDASSAWGGIMVNYASWLFWGMALLSMVWTYGMMVLKKADIQEFFAETIRFFGVTGFFWWILTNGPAISTSIIQSMQMIGAQAGGLDGKLYPSGIVDMGFDIFFRVLDQSSVWSPLDSACGMVLSGLILVILALIGVNMLLLLVSGWLLAYGGVFLLGFGGSRWTTDIAISYYKTVLSVGVQLMAMVLLVGIGKSFLDQYYNGLSAGVSLKEMAVMLVVAVILLALTNKIPPMLAGIVGSGGGSSGIGNFGAGAALGAAGMAATAAATAGAGAIAGASSAAGSASALKAAFQSAQESMAAGGGSSGAGGGSSGGRGSSGAPGGNSGGGFAAAMGNAGRFAADMGSSLAKGASQVAKEKAGAINDAAHKQVADTTGGKIGSAIREQSYWANSSDDSSQQITSNADALQHSFDGNALGAGEEAENDGIQTASINDEVAAFVNKTPREES
ncbi:P-type conjugative transfer protein TrbL [Collimonas sp. H4R21]|uniref:P-type conjugative transfer protein TrbL n=1 Tax=Collimonas rhizosphaerae TaxID=3126357 RepID=A0ABU9PWS2_9BURK